MCSPPGQGANKEGPSSHCSGIGSFVCKGVVVSERYKCCGRVQGKSRVMDSAFCCIKTLLVVCLQWLCRMRVAVSNLSVSALKK